MRNYKKKNKESNTAPKDLVFVFRYVNFIVDFDDDVVSKEMQEEISSIVSQASNEIWIDKTYVDFKDTNYEKTFITEKGWNNLCRYLHNTEYGKKADNETHAYIQEAYALMIVCYMYQFLEDLGYDQEGIFLKIKDGTMFMIQIFIDKFFQQKYPGKWQTWKMYN